MNQAGLKRFYPMVFVDFQKSLTKLAKYTEDSQIISFANLENPRDQSSSFNPYEDALKLLTYVDESFQYQLGTTHKTNKPSKMSVVTGIPTDSANSDGESLTF